MTLRPLRHERLWTAIGLGFVLIVVYLSLAANPPQAPRLLDLKAGHVIAYAWLMFWFAQIHASLRARALIALALCTLGVILEYLQNLTGYRTFAYRDMMDNAVGVAIGWGLGATALGGILGAVEVALERRTASK